MKKVLIAVIPLLLIPALAFGAEVAFKDVPDNHWARSAVYDLVKKGVTQGYPDGTFRGDNNITRYETAMFLSKLALMLDTSSQIDVSSLKADIKALKDELDSIKKSPSAEPKGLPVTGSFKARYRIANSFATGTASGTPPLRGPRIDYRLKMTLSKDLGDGAGVKINLDTMDSGFNGGSDDLAKKLLDIEGNLIVEVADLPINVKVTAGPGPVVYSATSDAVLPSEVGTVYMRPRNSLSFSSFLGAFDVRAGYIARTISDTGEVDVSQLSATIGYTFVGLPLFDTFKVYVTGDQLSADIMREGKPFDTRGMLQLTGAFNEAANISVKLGASRSELPNDGYYVGCELSLMDPWETGTFATVRYARMGPEYIVSSLSTAEFDIAGLDYFDKALTNNIQDWGIDFTQFLTKQLSLKIAGDIHQNHEGKYSKDIPKDFPESKCDSTLYGGFSYNIAPNTLVDLMYKVYQVPSNGEDQTTDVTALSFLYKF